MKPQIVSAKVGNLVSRNGIEFFPVFPANDHSYLIPKSILGTYGVKEGDICDFEKIWDQRSQRYHLRYNNGRSAESISASSSYEIGLLYEFEIVEFHGASTESLNQQTVVTVRDVEGKEYNVTAFKWQRNGIWNFNTIKCQVQNIKSDGSLILRNKDNRHPIYEANGEYKFKVIGELTKEQGGRKYHVLTLKGQDGCDHEVIKIPGQNFLHNKIDVVTCRVNEIKSFLRLSQVDIQDPFFVTFKDIVNDKRMERKYISNILNKQKSDLSRDEAQLVEQYTSKSAFWVFTFTNRVLIKLLYEAISRRNLELSIELNNLVLKFEKWILTKGIITSFPDENIRENTKLRAKQQLSNSEINAAVFEILSESPIDYLAVNKYFVDKRNIVLKLYNLLRFTGLEVCDCNMLVRRIDEILGSISMKDSSNIYQLGRLLNILSRGKRVFSENSGREYFSFNISVDSKPGFDEDDEKYALLTYAEILIYKAIGATESVNILSGKLTKFFSKTALSVLNREALLFTAYRFFQGYRTPDQHLPFKFEQTLCIDWAHLNAVSKVKIDTDDQWSQLQQHNVNKTHFKVRLVRKSQTGFVVDFDGISGLLPLNGIKSSYLKRFAFEDCDFTIYCRCILLSRLFNIFVIEQYEDPIKGPEYKNNSTAEIGQICDAVIKSVEQYGIFVSTRFGEGLLHISDIFDFPWNNDIYSYFSKGSKIKVVLIKIAIDGKLSFGFYQVKSSAPIYYERYVESLFSIDKGYAIELDNSVNDDSYLDVVQNECAFCIEQYAFLQIDIRNKIDNLLIAQQFYTSVKSARSYLLNIYISYFNILLQTKHAIDNKLLNEIEAIRKQAKIVSDSISQKTLSTFPDSDRLIFFLDIISLFGEKSNNSFEVLFRYINRYEEEMENSQLKTVAKITLANNLIISESTEDSDFSIKYLRFIYEYLSHGIFSLKESLDDRIQREINQEVLNWKIRIDEDESENLEFKSTIFTPILDEKSKSRLEKLLEIKQPSDTIRTEIDKIQGNLAKKAIMHSSMKTLAAFSNTSGGTLLIGVSDNRDIVGIESDYGVLSKRERDRDGYGKLFDATLRDYFGDFFSALVTRKFLRFPEGDILIVTVKPCSHEVFLLRNEEGKLCEQLFIRNLSSSKELIGSELAKFVRNIHTKQIYRSLDVEPR